MKLWHLITSAAAIVASIAVFALFAPPKKLLSTILTGSYSGSAELVELTSGNLHIQALLDDREITFFLPNQDSTPELYLFQLLRPEIRSRPFLIRTTKDRMYLVLSSGDQASARICLVNLKSNERVYPSEARASRKLSGKQDPRENIDEILANAGGINTEAIDNELFVRQLSGKKPLGAREARLYENVISDFRNRARKAD